MFNRDGWHWNWPVYHDEGWHKRHPPPRPAPPPAPPKRPPPTSGPTPPPKPPAGSGNGKRSYSFMNSVRAEERAAVLGKRRYKRKKYGRKVSRRLASNIRSIAVGAMRRGADNGTYQVMKNSFGVIAVTVNEAKLFSKQLTVFQSAETNLSSGIDQLLSQVRFNGVLTQTEAAGDAIGITSGDVDVTALNGCDIFIKNYYCKYKFRNNYSSGLDVEIWYLKAKRDSTDAYDPLTILATGLAESMTYSAAAGPDSASEFWNFDPTKVRIFTDYWKVNSYKKLAVLPGEEFDVMLSKKNFWYYPDALDRESTIIYDPSISHAFMLRVKGTLGHGTGGTAACFMPGGLDYYCEWGMKCHPPRIGNKFDYLRIGYVPTVDPTSVVQDHPGAIGDGVTGA